MCFMLYQHTEVKEIYTHFVTIPKPLNTKLSNFRVVI